MNHVVRNKMHRYSAAVAFIIMLGFLLLFFPSRAQFYNGSQLTFGKSRVQFKNFFWSYFRFEKFDTYYYLNGKELAMYAAEYADKHIKEIETTLQSSLEEKVQFIIFNNLTDLKQSNIGLEYDWESYNTGGVTKIIGGKVLVYFDGNYDHFERQIRAGIANVILNEMIYGAGIGAQIKNNAIFTMPEWYMNGLISFISEKWNPEIDNIVKDAILGKKYEKFNHLTGKEAAFAGQSLWNYISIKYGETSIPNIVYIARLNRNVEKGFLYVLGISFKELIADWLAFYKGVYTMEDPSRTDPAGEKINKKPKPERTYRQLKISPDGKYAAWCVHDLDIYKVYLYDLETKKSKRIYRGGYRLADKPDFSFPILAWHPTGEVLAIITEKKGEDYLFFYTLKTKTFDRQILHDFQKIIDFDYSDDGSKLVFSAVQKGQSDIYVYSIIAGSYEQITKDVYNDLNPRFISHSDRIIFSSNRTNDTVRFDPLVRPKDLQFYNDIFVYDYAGKKNILQRITSTPLVNEIQPMAYDDRFFCFLSDQNGILNRYLARFDSTITFVDTATHYRYFTTSFPITNYSRNILEQDVNTSAAMIGDVVFLNNHYEMTISDRIGPKYVQPLQLRNSFYEDYRSGLIPGRNAPEQKDTIQKKKEEVGPPGKKHFSTVRRKDVVVKGGEKDYYPLLIAEQDYDTIRRAMADTSQKTRKPSRLRMPAKDTADKYRTAKALNYNVEYSVNQMVTQIDFNYLNSAYQPFTGAKEAIFINPGLNALFMVGITDLMEDYKIVGGVRLNFNFVNNEYLLSYANLRRRLDHQFIFHRQSIEETGYYSYIRHRIHELFYISTYPFTPVFNIKGTATIRYDRAVYLSTDQFNLSVPDVNRYWGSLKGELTYDNTRSTGLNLYNGTRYKLFGEYYQLLNGNNNNVFILGADFRHYVKIHRSMILALRGAASTSFGSNRLVYYMGGVDNWLFPSFDNRTPVAYDQNYVFQTLATNMRGFNQNIRNGNSFFVINSEIRLPVFRYFYNRPIRSDFLNNFQMVTFFDIGTAWTGWSPYSEKNQLFTTYIYNKPLFIKVELLKEPIVEGFGGGLRTRIFGYFIRGDVAWGIEEWKIKKPIFYLSLSTDF